MRGGYIRQERPYVTFAALFVSEKREKKKSFFMFLRGRTMFDPYKIKLNIPNPNKTSAPKSRSFVFIFPYLLFHFVFFASAPAAVGISGSVKCLP